MEEITPQLSGPYSKTLKSTKGHLTSSNSKPLSVLLFVPLFLAILDKKYAKETDMDKNKERSLPETCQFPNQSVSLTSNCKFKTLKSINGYILEF